MPVFYYRSKTEGGRTVTGYRYAPNENQAVQEISSEGGIPIRISPARRGRGRIKLKINDSRNLSAMLGLLIGSGHRLKTSLELAASADEGNRIGMACTIWRDELEKGRGFKEILMTSPVRLPPSFIALTSIGESIGQLGSIFSRLGHYYQKLSEIKNKFISSLIYPGIVLFFTIAAFILLSVVAFPTLREVSEIRAGENALEAESEAENNRMPVILIVTISAVVGLAGLLTVLATRQKDVIAWASLRAPFAGSFIIEWNLMNWAFAVEMIIGGGLTLSQALREALSSITNRHLRGVFARIARSSESGESLSTLFRRESIIPPIVASWIRLGENTGSSSEVFGSIRSYFEELIEQKTSVISQLLQPILILIVGIIVIAFVVVYVLPIIPALGSTA